MRIWVIGADPVARALGRSWAQAGHEVLFTFSFDGTDFDALAAGTGGRHGTLAEGAAAGRGWSRRSTRWPRRSSPRQPPSRGG